MSREVDTRNWGELGPAMRDLSEQQRLFVQHYIAEVMVKPHGAPTRAAAAAGYKSNNRSNLGKQAHDLLHDPSRSPKVVAAIQEESARYIRAGAPEAVAALFNVIRNPEHKDHVRAIGMIVDRTDPIISKQVIDVTHRQVDPDKEALEEMRAAKQLGATRDKLLELFGANGLDRLEALEAVEMAQRSASAKIIEHNG
jgi:phage terminase small subunit